MTDHTPRGSFEDSPCRLGRKIRGFTRCPFRMNTHTCMTYLPPEPIYSEDGREIRVR